MTESVSLIKHAQLDLLNELKRICEKNHISYCLIAGTLIGAIRHEGFIPWDDDIDVGMLREEYDRFIEACQKELDPAYFLHDWNTDKNSPLPFMKMKIKGTHFRESLSENSGMSDEIFIDIFPYDSAPENSFGQSIQAIRSYLIQKILLVRCGFSLDRGNPVKKILYGLLNVLSRIRSVDSWKKEADKVMKQYNDQKTEYVITMNRAASYQKERKKRDMFINTEPHIFEGSYYQIPCDYDTFLKELYGDYMKFPPVEERTGRHEIVLSDLGDYKIRSLTK